jgi:hypothetical protein
MNRTAYIPKPGSDHNIDKPNKDGCINFTPPPPKKIQEMPKASSYGGPTVIRATVLIRLGELAFGICAS